MNARFHIILLLSSLVALCGVAAEPSDLARANTNATNTAASKAISARLQWNRHTLVEDYDKIGDRDVRWDADARASLEAFARIRSNPAADLTSDFKILTARVQKAVGAGCTDPLIGYLHARFVSSAEARSAGEAMVIYRPIANKMQASAYHPLRKAYAAIWTADAVNRMADALGQAQPDMKIILDGRVYRGSVRSNVVEAVRDKSLPAEEIFELCNVGFDRLQRTASGFDYYSALEPLLLKEYGNDYRLHYLKARVYKEHAWRARGIEVAAKVSDDQFKLFEERLNVAAEEIRQAWKLNSQDPKVPTLMIPVLMGLNEDRTEMEKWFKHAMALDPGNYTACKSKMYFLEPKWHGSPEEMLEFGRECAKSNKWKGEIPLLLQGAHETLAGYLGRDQQEQYWSRPEVWKDIRESFESYYAHPDADPGWRHNYARMAAWCQHADAFIEQVSKFKGTNYAFFGGKETFDEMVKYAREQVTKNGKDR